MLWFEYLIQWYAMLFLIGIIFFPLTKKLFGRFFDLGYSFSKIIGILFLTFTVYVFSIFRILPFTQVTIYCILFIFALINYVYSKNFKSKLDEKDKKKILKIIIFEEILFFIALLAWTYIRGQEPSIRGLEKFMDFGFINAALKSPYFPPQDIWLSGDRINYYYFGHIIGAVLTQLSGIISAVSYNLILATLFALGITEAFSLSANIVYHAFKRNLKYAIIAGILGAFLVNLGGNLHTCYVFTEGYNNESPTGPCWSMLSGYHPEKYWYPNATRYIPYTIHEFPIYSYVVADLHGHVFDIPLVILTLALLFLMILLFYNKQTALKLTYKTKSNLFLFLNKLADKITLEPKQLLFTILLGLLASVHYMTNAFDGGIYALLTILLFFFIFKSFKSAIMVIFLLLSFTMFVLPFSTFFKPFVTGIGVNCSPESLIKLKSIGPFYFEADKCQLSAWWMLLTLWGFFWFNLSFLIYYYLKTDWVSIKNNLQKKIAQFAIIVLLFSVWLIIIPEFFYIRDIYPTHFRANTMFKLGYQAFTMSNLMLPLIFIMTKDRLRKKNIVAIIHFVILIPLLSLIILYPTYAIRSYYGTLQKEPQLNGTLWIKDKYEEYLEIITYLNTYAENSSVILEAQGDSYTDYNVVSSYTGLSTVAGWWVHQWLWKGSPDVVGKRIPDIQTIYESKDATAVEKLLNKYNIKYIIIGSNEIEKYKNLDTAKFNILGKLVLTTSNGKGEIYQIY